MVNHYIDNCNFVFFLFVNFESNKYANHIKVIKFASTIITLKYKWYKITNSLHTLG